MKNFLIKIGKTKAVLAKDGLRNGVPNISRKVWKLFKGLFRWVHADIVFVSSGLGDASMYRTDYIAEELRMYGFKTAVLFKDDPLLLLKSKKAKVIILYRANYDSKTKKLLNQAIREKQSIIYDTDDLVFDIELFKKTDAYKNFNSLQKKQYEKSVGLEILESENLQAITTPTVFLAEKLNRFNKPVFIVRNKLSQQEQKWSWQARKQYLNRKKTSKQVRLGYFSGSISHNKDFQVIVPALEQIFEQYDNVLLYLVGYIDVEDRFFGKWSDKIVQLPFVPRHKHYQNIAQVDINLAPLEMNEFCRAKSELKFFEAGIVGIPTIATKNETFSKAIIEGKTGMLAGDTNEWVKKITKLITDKELRLKIGENARQVVLRKYLTRSGDNDEYYKFLERIVYAKKP